MSSFRFILLLHFTTIPPIFCSAAEQYAISFEGNAEAHMRDGVVLFAGVYRPDVDGNFPVLLLHTLHDKQNDLTTELFLLSGATCSSSRTGAAVLPLPSNGIPSNTKPPVVRIPSNGPLLCPTPTKSR